MSLSGRVALITGASQGIGRACALRLAASGATVAVAARNLEKLTELVQQIEASGGKAFAFPVDVTDEEQVKATFKSALAQLGKIDIHQQRRNHPRPTGHAHEARRLGFRSQHQPDIGLSLHSASNRFHAQAALGPHHQHNVSLRSDGPGWASKLCSLESRLDWIDHGHCPRGWIAQHNVQRSGAWFHRNRNDLRFLR